VSTPQTTPSFEGLRVLSFESRRASEVAALITTYGGQPSVVPALREVTLESNAAALDFIERLMRNEFDITIFLTGVGTRELLTIAAHAQPRDAVIAALSRTKVVVRGPKPLAVLRELRVPMWAIAAEPNTWRELLVAIEARSVERPLRGARVAVQEYGVSNEELMNALAGRGAIVTRVPVYRWALPEDVGPLKAAVAATARGELDVVIFTTGVQLVHVWRIAREMHLEEPLRRELARAVVASIGPTTSEEVRRHGLSVDFEASHPKFGALIRELAEHSAALLRAKGRDSESLKSEI
jgi:uroporphyrinogen-III synthase